MKPAMQLLAGISLSSSIAFGSVTPIARWDTVPYQLIDQQHPLRIGVVAFSKGTGEDVGINYVEFTVIGQGHSATPIVVSDPTVNPDTGVYEYWTLLSAGDFSTNGLFTVEAQVVGRDDGVRTAATAGRGLAPLPLLVDGSATPSPVEIWVSNNGNDRTGNGSEENPVATIGAALEAIDYFYNLHPEEYFKPVSSITGGVIYLKAGVYDVVAPQWGLDIPNTAGWVTVIGDPGTVLIGGTTPAPYTYDPLPPGVDPDECDPQHDPYDPEVCPYEYNPGWPPIANGGVRLRFQNITIVRTSSPDSGYAIGFGNANAEVDIWLDHCTIVGYDRYSTSNPNPIDSLSTFRNAYVTDTHMQNLWNAVSGAGSNWSEGVFGTQLCRNVTVSTIADDAFQNVPLVINCAVDDVDPWPLGPGPDMPHADCWQHFAGDAENQWDDNVIVYGLRGTNLKYQGIFIAPNKGYVVEKHPVSGACVVSERPPEGNLPQQQAQGMAFVNVYLEMAHSEAAPVNWAGASDWSRAVNHLLWWNCTFRNTDARKKGMTIWGTVSEYFTDTECNVSGAYSYSISNMSVIGCDFNRLGVTGTPVDDDFAGWTHNHFVNADSGDMTEGSQFTTGDDMLDGRGAPRFGSPLLRRFASADTVTVDAGNYARGPLSDVGAYQARLVYVDSLATAGEDDGSTWEDAFLSLRDALDGAPEFSTVLVANGPYTPVRQADPEPAGEETFQLKNKVEVYGGFEGGEDTLEARDLTNRTVLQAANTQGVKTQHVVTGSGTDATALLDGFEITGGTSYGLMGAGGGVYNVGGSPTIRNCYFRSNWATNGGAIANLGGSPRIVNCLFAGNHASEYGGAISNRMAAPKIVNCVLFGNTAGEGGGGVWNNTPAAGLELVNCTLVANVAWSLAGGIENDGYAPYSSAPSIRNCVLWLNQGRGSYYHEYEDQIHTASGLPAPSISNCCIEGIDPPWSDGNIGDYPEFIQDESALYNLWWQVGIPGYPPFLEVLASLRLRYGSPCIDAGDDEAVPFWITTDVSLAARVVDGDDDTVAVVDMGAYEADPESTDCNGNSIPDACDISCEESGCSEYQDCGSSSDSEPNGIPDECEVQSGSLLGPTVEPQVDLADFGLVCRCLGSPATGDCAEADLSGDGYVDEDDVIAWQAAQLER